jgi:hypothetical protein
MTHAQFQSVKVGDRIEVVRYAKTSRTRTVVDEYDGDVAHVAVMRKVGSDVGTVTARNDTELVTVCFDNPVPDINYQPGSKMPPAKHNWSVYFRDVLRVIA